MKIPISERKAFPLPETQKNHNLGNGGDESQFVELK